MGGVIKKAKHYRLMEIIWKNIDKFCTPIDEESHFSKKLKTNIKGVWKIEWYTPPFVIVQAVIKGMQEVVLGWVLMATMFLE